MSDQKTDENPANPFRPRSLIYGLRPVYRGCFDRRVSQRRNSNRSLIGSNSKRILTELQVALPSLQVNMETAKVSLARGIWPGLSISIPRLHLIKPEACGETFGKLELENIDLPLDIVPLFWSRVHWATVSVGHMTLTYSHQDLFRSAFAAGGFGGGSP